MARQVRGEADFNGPQGGHRRTVDALGLEELQVKLLTCVGLQIVYWGALLKIVQRLSDERLVVMAFAVTLAISMITAVVMLVKPRE
jgi:hypothetical protein